MFQKGISLSDTSVKSNIAPYKIVMQSKPEIDCSHRLCMLHNQYKYHQCIITICSWQKPFLRTHQCSLCSNAISLKFYHNILNLSEREIISDTICHSEQQDPQTSWLSDTSAPKNNESVSEKEKKTGEEHCQKTCLFQQTNSCKLEIHKQR